MRGHTHSIGSRSLKVPVSPLWAIATAITARHAALLAIHGISTHVHLAAHSHLTSHLAAHSHLTSHLATAYLTSHLATAAAVSYTHLRAHETG